MPLTLLQLVQRTYYELGLPNAPNAVIGSTDEQVLQFLHLANAVGQELVTEFDWQRLRREFRFTTTYLSTVGDVVSNSTVVSNISNTSGVDNLWQIAGNGIPQFAQVVTVDAADQVTITDPATVTTNATSLNFGKTLYTLTSAYDRLVNRTQWDRSQHWRVLGPESPQVWQWLRGGVVASGPRIRFRIRDNMVEIFPLVTTSNRVYFEYIANTWVATNTNALPTGSAYAADTDIAVFKDRVMQEGLKLKFFQAKGFDTTAFEVSYARELDKAKAQDQGAPTLSLGRPRQDLFISPGNIRDQDFGEAP